VTGPEEQLRRALNATPEQQQVLAALAEDLAPRVYLVAGGTPAARELARALDDPELRARLEEGCRQIAEHARLAIEPVFAALGRAVEAYGLAVRPVVEQLRDAGVLTELPPEEPRERALWVRQHRGTGPDRQVQHRPRPRRVP
jgi:hypothetical protein